MWGAGPGQFVLAALVPMADGIVAVVPDDLFIANVHADGRATLAHALDIQDTARPYVRRNLPVLGQG